MDPIFQFLQHQTLPADPAEARHVHYRSTRYLIINGTLYERGFSLLYLRCLTREEGNYVLQEIHKGIYGNHSGAQSLAHKAIVTNNSSRQFDKAKFKQFCSNLKIHLCFASLIHPKSNGQVKAVNKIIKKTLKTKLDKAKVCWPERLLAVLWSYRTTIRTSTGETPFPFTFGIEAIVPVEIAQPFSRTSAYDADTNDDQLALNLDLVDELRYQANMHNFAYKQHVDRIFRTCAIG
ncbi:hypothetical protein L3X38_042259 [Prunus dulcis]|uniref:Integrase catalytic domain-containing protein n=1 Tax=Prunus dulcis TaxID=3755 RepID=A0AAD4UUI4_PRUDU|nr:hypothetical protein L3X38_042259 [Prunus dulcis]